MSRRPSKRTTWRRRKEWIRSRDVTCWWTWGTPSASTALYSFSDTQSNSMESNTARARRVHHTFRDTVSAPLPVHPCSAAAEARHAGMACSIAATSKHLGLELMSSTWSLENRHLAMSVERAKEPLRSCSIIRHQRRERWYHPPPSRMLTYTIALKMSRKSLKVMRLGVATPLKCAAIRFSCSRSLWWGAMRRISKSARTRAEPTMRSIRPRPSAPLMSTSSGTATMPRLFSYARKPPSIAWRASDGEGPKAANSLI
mmetsp:Transcript_24545/g.77599  ORF Transcript_24545/g.77599 Transcript_24545/m.77599 type:complete len:257 (-) Transcript_24545:2429-3199(-)